MPEEEKQQIVNSVIIFELPIGINLPDGNYTITTDKGQFGIILKKIENKNPVGIPSNVKIAGGTTISGDRWGRLHHTAVNVIFPYSTPQDYSPIIETDMRKDSIEIINRLLIVYSYVTNDPIQKLAQVDIFSESYRHFDSQGKDVPGLAFSLSGGGNFMKMGGAALTPEPQLTEIKKMLEENTKIPIYDELILNSKNHLFYDSPRLAVIEANTAFEVFVNILIYSGYKKKNYATEKIENILETPFSNLLKDHIRQVTSCDFENTAEYNNWKDNAYEIRNKIIHEGIEITKNDATKVVEIYVDTMSFLEKQII